MKSVRFIFSLLLLAFCVNSTLAQVLLDTSFEQTQAFTTGSIHNQNAWKVNSGTATIVNNEAFQGEQALKTAVTGSALSVDFQAFASGVAALGGDVYVDFYMKQKSLPTVNYAITGYDFGSDTHRSFMIEFQPTGKLKLYDGSSGWSVQPTYTLNEWIRISIKIEHGSGKYQLAINGTRVDKLFAFREIKNNAMSFDFHAIRFSMSSGSCEALIDDIYIGATPLSDVSFAESSTDRTISITQPDFGSINISPSKAVYQLDEEITASVQVPEHFIFTGWTGDLSGSENPLTFRIQKNMVIGALVTINPLDPPTQYTLSINQVTGANITVQPSQEQYYSGTTLTASLSLESGYQFEGWSGDITGTVNPISFVISKNMQLSASVTEINIPPVLHNVSTVTQFKTALNVMNPGDTILVADGNYNMGSVKVTRGGSTAKPILIKSHNLLGAKFTGNTSFTLSSQSHVTYEGFDFTVEPVSTIIKMEGCSYVRITRNRFSMPKLSDTQSSKWITVGEIWANPVCNSHHNRIDHNLFEGKYDAGAWLIIDGSHGTVPDISKYDQIDHNIFRNNTPRVANEKETIRIGVSDLSMLHSYTLVENNLFEDCDGDPEIVSVKSCSNIVRGNTFRRCLGTLSLRHGHQNTVSGNYFLGENKTGLYNNAEIGTGGVRVYGMNHKVYNNYFEGLTGKKWDAAITITNGDVTNTSSSLTSHFLPENIIFSNNTLVNNVSNIEIGFDNNGSYGRAPKNCLIVNNIVLSDDQPIVKAYSAVSLSSVGFENNIFFPTGTATIGISDQSSSQISIVDPKLVVSDCRASNNCDYKTNHFLYKLSAESPAINASHPYDFVNTDMEGQALLGLRDLGADEHNPNDPVIAGPLDETTAGPLAIEGSGFESSVISGIITPMENTSRVYPNPFTGTCTIQLPGNESGKVDVSIYNPHGILLQRNILKMDRGVIELNSNYKGLLIVVIRLEERVYTFQLISK